MNLDLSAIRARNAALLARSGFRFAKSLPLRGQDELAVRPRDEIVKRLTGLWALCAYVAAPPTRYPDDDLSALRLKHGLDAALTPDERSLLAMPRAEANQAHAGSIGWRMENMVSLAWALGHPLEPAFDGAMIDGDELTSLLRFAPNDPAACATMLAARILRATQEIVAMEDLFYCAHNAARCAQLGDLASVPRGFDPVAGGGVIHERRHALTWMLSPGVPWDDTDLST